MTDADSDAGLARRVVRRVRPDGLNELKGLRVRCEALEVAAAENQALRAATERVLAEIEARVAVYARARSDPEGAGAPSHAPSEVTGG